MARWLRDDGWAPFYATGISPDNTLHENATRMGQVIAQACRELGVSRAHVIAFSMGGLNTRAYTESSLYQDNVERAFILGTPHRGEHLWSTFLLWEHLAWRDEPSSLELLPIHARLFNATHRPTTRVPYTLVAGDARAERVPTLFRQLPPSDGLVSTWSALGLGEWPASVERHVTKDIHAWGEETILLDVPTLLLPRSTYDTHIRPWLFSEQRTWLVERADESADYAAPRMAPRSALRTGVLAPGQTRTLAPLPIGELANARFYLRWKGEPLEMRLRDPLGREVDADASLDREDVEYLELGFADLAGYVLTNTLPGPWEVVLESAASNEAASQYIVYADIASDVRVSLQTDRDWYEPGDAVSITVRLEGRDGQACLDRVEVDIRSPSRAKEAVRLRPMGTEGLAPSTECFGGEITVREGGYYTLLMNATGRQGAGTLERGAETVIGVSTRVARLTGAPEVRDAVNAGGLSSPSIEMSVAVEADEQASLLCAATLRGPDGARLVGAHPFEMAPGRQAVALRLGWEAPVAESAAPASAAAYWVESLTLLDISGAGILLDERHFEAVP